jgi:hypothetical protein
LWGRGEKKNRAVKQTICILIVFVFAGLSSFGQVTDTTFYPSGQIKEIKLIQGDKILQATVYKSDGQVKYQWDIEKKELKSFDAISYTDTLAEYFKSNCPDYTLFQHYGNGPIMEIENYQAGNRHGAYQKFDSGGRLISKGQFDNWGKVGIWTYYDTFGKEDHHIHWFHHNFSDGGISIDYTIIPVGLALLLIFAVLILFLKYSSFSNFFIAYSFVIIGLFVILYLVSSFASDQTVTTIRTHVGKYVFPMLTTLTLAMTSFSLTALAFKKRTGIKMRFSFLFLVTSIGLCFILLGAYIGSKVTGAVM